MPELLRVITNPKWVAPDWLPPGEVPADALTDLRADRNEVSVWLIDDGRTNLNEVLIALASQRQRLDKLDYALIDETSLASIDVASVESSGRTPHTRANQSWHRDLVRLTGSKVVRLAALIMPVAHMRVTERRIRELLVKALETGSIDPARLDPALLNEVRQTAK